MWCVPHPRKPDHTLVLLDTEGLGDIEKGDNQNDSWIFALAILLSSTFVYNSMGTINQQAMDQLQYPFCSSEWPQKFLFYLPAGTTQNDQNFNLPRLCIRRFFPKKKCFVFDRPTHRKKLGQLEKLHDNELDPDFVQQATVFCSYIFTESKTKTLPGGIKVNGPRLEKLVQTYIDAISRGDLPCMENAVLALAQIENAAAVQKAIAHYDQKMSQMVQLPTETLQKLLNLHRTCEKEAIELFMKNSFKDVDQLCQKDLAAQLEKKLDDFCKQNVQASTDRCSDLLKYIFTPLEEAVKKGDYFKPGGYRLFLQKTQELKRKYLQKPNKGIQAEEVLQAYLKSKESVTDAILQTDQSLTAKEKEIEVERVKAESAQAAAKVMEEILSFNGQKIPRHSTSYESGNCSVFTGSNDCPEEELLGLRPPKSSLSYKPPTHTSADESIKGDLEDDGVIPGQLWLIHSGGQM
ncbi:guanylate-binding protein 1-like [Suricata suricatta]|uniref:guanylate-binding protein 1-like n=1 Tax=Suricata suricatta TaxID=37032 RepID=UPI001155B00F|nr:guanylate-binding protein 1-like [Suricata suricatta]